MNESLSDRDTPPCSSKKRGKHCATFDCYNYSFYDGNGLFTGHHFFRFPTEIHQRKRCCNLIKRQSAQNISSQRILLKNILVPRGRDPFGQHRGSRPLAGSNFRVRDLRTSSRSAQSQDFCKMGKWRTSQRSISSTRR